MAGKHGGAHHAFQEHDTTDSEEGKCKSISNRLDRLETEINLLLQLSSKKAAKSDKTDAMKLKEKRSNMISIESVFRNRHMNEISEEDEDTEEVMTVRHVNADGQSHYVLNNMLSVDDEPLAPNSHKAMKQKRLKEKAEKQAQDETNAKKLRRKRSVCKCRRKRSPENEARTRCTLARRRSKSADPKNLMPTSSTSGSTSDEERAARTKQAPATRSCPASTHDLQELREIVTDLNKSNALAKTISETWKEKFLDLQKHCDSLKTLQEQTIAQKMIISSCIQAEMQHRNAQVPDACDKCRTSASKDELTEVKHTLEKQRSRNEELISVCEDLRQELKMSEERLKGLKMSQDAKGKLEKQVLEKFESREELLISQANAKTEEFKKQIKEHLGEIEELRLTCAKNAEWACEESSLKSKLQQENRFLHKKLSLNIEKEQKHLDQINVLRKALVKVGRNDPRVMKLLQTLEKYEWRAAGSANEDMSMVTVGVHLTEIKDRSNSTGFSPSDAKRLIQELNSVISGQRNRIQELIDLTSTLIEADEADVDMAPSREQVREEVEQVRGRYVALAATVKDLKVDAKQNKRKLAEETRSRMTFEKEVTLLTKRLDESRSSVFVHSETIENQHKEIVAKDEEISKLEKEIVEVKRENDALHKELQARDEQAQAFKQSFDRLRLDNKRQATIIDNLDKKFELQRQEQFLQKLAIAKEKEQAMRAAEFATNKLMETMEDYRSQNKSQSKVRHALTKMLREKDEQLRWAIDKVSAMTLDPRQIVDALKSLQPATHAPNDATALEVSIHYRRDSGKAERLLQETIRKGRQPMALELHEFDETDLLLDAAMEAHSDGMSEYDTPQLYTLQEEEDEDEEEDKICMNKQNG